MRSRPGPNLLWAAGLFVVLALICFAWHLAWLFLLPALPALFVLAFRDYREITSGSKSLSVSRDIPVCAARGRPFQVSISITNNGDSKITGEVRDVLPKDGQPALWRDSFDLPAGDKLVLRYQTQIPVRGLHRFGSVWIRLRGSCGMVERQQSFEPIGEIKVLPESAVPTEESLRDIYSDIRLSGKWVRTHLMGDGTEFDTISQYHEGDDPRRIDWRSSAKRNTLMVRRYHLEQHRDLVILLDCGRLMGTAAEKGTKLDRAVDSALLLARVALAKGDRCGLGIFDNEVLGFLPPQSGERSYQILMESLYKVQSRWRESNFDPIYAAIHSRQSKRALIIVLSDIVDVETSERFREGLAALRGRHMVLFAALQTPLLKRQLHAPIESLRDVSRKAVVMRLMREREKALHSLTRSGISVVDTEPSRLTAPLVNRYVELRERNLL